MTFTGRGLYAASSKEPRRRRRGAWLLVGAVLALALLVTGVIGAVSNVHVDLEPRSDTYGGVERIAIESEASGTITVTGAAPGAPAPPDAPEPPDPPAGAEDRPEPAPRPVAVGEVTVDRSFSGSPVDRPEENAELEEGTLELDASCAGFFSGCAADYEITVPAGVAVEIEADSADVEVAGVDAPVNVETSSGTIDLAGVTGDVEVSSSSGDLSLDGIEGGVDADTETGSVTVAGNGPYISVESTRGEIDLRGFDADSVEVESTTGEVALDGAFRTAAVETTTGSVEITAAERFDLLEVESTTGSVGVLVPEGGAYRVLGESVTGDRAVDVAVDGDARSVIDATTTTGSVTVGHA
jgi:hypothetical protein